MKKFKKILALVVAMVMIIATMNIAAFAAAGDLTVNGNLEVSGLDAGDTVTYYQILKWNGTETDDTTQGWTWGKDITAASMSDADLAALVGNGTEGSGSISSTLAGKIAAAVTGGTDDTTANGKWSETVTDAGLYMVIVHPATAGVMYNPVFVAANWVGDGETADSSNKFAVVLNDKSYSDKAMAKKSSIPLDKKSTGTDSNNNVNVDNMSYTTDVGETVNFEVTTKVPKFAANYTNPVFKLTDNLNGLGLVANSVVVTKADGSALPAGSYTIGSYAEGATSYTVTFTPAYLKGEDIPADGQEVKIVYSAKVTDKATKIVNQEENTVDLVFSTSPTDETGHGLLRDKTNHFTFSIDADLLGHGEINESSTEAIKVGVDADGKPIVESKQYAWSKEWHSPLEGAEFKLYTDAACKNLYTNPEFNGTVKSDASGRITIKGLDAATYYLKETKAPAGYVKMTDIVTVKITADITENVSVKDEVDNAGQTVEVTYKTNVLNGYEVEFTRGDQTTKTTYTMVTPASKSVATSADRATTSKDFELPNTKGVELPSTGGMGTTLFYIVGAILVLGAGILLVSKRRMSAN